MTDISLTVNGIEHEVDVDPTTPLADLLHDELGYKGTKQSCSTGICGACTVRIDGQARKSCLHMAGQVAGAEVQTVEGLETDGELSPIQAAFIDEFSFQCGFCTPGVLMSTAALLDENPDPDEDEIVDALHGNICRCTGYIAIVDGVKEAARRLQDE